MKYGIKIYWDEAKTEFTWLSSLSEYESDGNIELQLFSSKEEAERFASRCSWKMYEIAPYGVN